MSFFDDLVNEFESSFKPSVPTFDREKLQAVINTMDNYEQAIDSDCTLEVLVKHEAVIRQYITDLIQVVRINPDITDTAEFDIILRKAFGFGIINQEGCLRESAVTLTENDPVFATASRSLASALDAYVDPKIAISRAIKFAAKKHNMSEIEWKYRYQDKLIKLFNILYSKNTIGKVNKMRLNDLTEKHRLDRYDESK
jgi:hypothetical protein